MSLTLSSATPIGVDIAKAKFDAALVEGKYKTKVFPNRPAGFEAFLIWLRPFAPVCLPGSYRTLWRRDSALPGGVGNYR